MGRKSICLVSCFSMILSLSGCFQDAESSVEMSKSDESSWITTTTTTSPDAPQATDTTSEVLQEVDPDSEDILFGASINMYEMDENHNIGGPMGYQIAIRETQTVDICLNLRVQTNSADRIPVTLWVIADGEFIPFCADGDTEASEHQFDIVANASNQISLSFHGEKTFRFITVVADVFSTNIPSSNYMSYSGIISYTLFNTNCTQLEQEPTVSADHYVSVSPQNENIGCEIDTIPISENAQRATCATIHETMEISADKKELWIKFNKDQIGGDSTPLSEYFSVFLLCDGKPQPVFDGQYTYLVHTPAESTDVSSDRAFCYQIPEDLIPDQGTHIYQVVAVPFFFANAEAETEEAHGILPISSNKIRVQVTGGS